jgi:phosphoserine phosphatase
MTRILLARHGQTEWNRVERFRGQIDVPLNAVGRQQAQALAIRLTGEPIDIVCAGPLERARDTAAPLALRLGQSVQILDGFMDINYGAWAGISPAEAAEQDPELAARWRSAPHLVRFPDGEGLSDIRQRIVTALEEVISQLPNGTAFLVGHQVVNKVLLCAVLGLDNSSLWRIGQDNACLNILEHHDGLYNIITLNDTCHLDQ